MDAVQRVKPSRSPAVKRSKVSDDLLPVESNGNSEDMATTCSEYSEIDKYSSEDDRREGTHGNAVADVATEGRKISTPYIIAILVGLAIAILLAQDFINYQQATDDDEKGKSGQHGHGGTKQYLLMNGDKGETVIVDAETFAEVSRISLPETKDGAIAVTNDIFYVINTATGEIACTQVLNLLTSKSIAWDTCANFPPTSWARGNVAAIGGVIYFRDRTHLYAFDTKSKVVKKLDEIGGKDDIYYSLVELNGLIYSRGATALQFTDGTNGWTAIDMPESFARYSSYLALVKMQGSVCMVGGFDGKAAFCYNPKTKSWSTGDRMNEHRAFAATVELGGKGTLVVGGKDGNEWLDSTLLWDELSKKWIASPYKTPSNLEWPQAVTFYA